MFENESTKAREYCVEKHNMVFVIGDLNFRIAMPNLEVRKLSAQENWSAMQEHDELLALKQKSPLITYFKEGPINFPPTYKYDKRTNRYDTSKKKRTPSWCDRILWSKNHNIGQYTYHTI